MWKELSSVLILIGCYTRFGFAMGSSLQTGPVGISLQKKTFLKDKHGIFNLSAVKASHLRTKKKYYSRLPGESVQINKRTHRHADRSSHTNSPWRRQAEGLTDQGNQMWTGQLQVGTPGQTFSVDFDTGSADFWIPSSDCNPLTCSPMNTYEASASSTASAQAQAVSITYGDDSSAAGTEYHDTVKIAGITISNQAFAGASVLKGSAGEGPMDGILGLAYPAVSRFKFPSIIDNAFDQGLIPSKQFSFKLADEGSELFLGGVNPSKFSGQLESHPVSRKAYWQIAGGSVYVNNQKVEQNEYQTIFDTGTTIIYGPASAVEKMYSSVAGSSRYEEIQGFWKFPCSNTPKVSFSWNGGNKWEVESHRMILGQIEDNTTECVGSISSQTLGFSTNTWLLGDTFLGNVYSVFNPTENTISFAKPT